ncbi:hypothetical protein [Neorhizobium sp. AL 9.2.2]|uniref:hypothetical protein n=1 Tax=Neorhizobium sp. AL 9.2.2 TaxID=2712894 RepID=UPI001571B7F6|nr:hypothetical protein [Neorhizobium sp. AL 9.2.2]NSY17713.1 hypothetical protein [Neorhizobium sp. AL 9.2.2]
MSQSVYEKVYSDSNLEDLVKAELLNLCASATSEIGVKETFDAFASTRRLTGSNVVSLNNGEIVGNIKNLRGLSEFLERVLGQPRADIEQSFRMLAGAGTTLDEEAAKIWFRDEILGHTEVIYIARSPAWFFRSNPGWNAEDVFRHSDVGCLPCRLGLPMLVEENPLQAGVEYLGICVPGDHLSNIRLPSCLDGDYKSVKDIWLHTGYTQPIPHGSGTCVSLGGLPEVVASAPSFAAISTDLTLFET